MPLLKQPFHLNPNLSIHAMSSKYSLMNMDCVSSNSHVQSICQSPIPLPLLTICSV
jgi:hypothetical protein